MHELVTPLGCQIPNPETLHKFAAGGAEAGGVRARFEEMGSEGAPFHFTHSRRREMQPDRAGWVGRTKPPSTKFSQNGSYGFEFEEASSLIAKDARKVQCIKTPDAVSSPTAPSALPSATPECSFEIGG